MGLDLRVKDVQEMRRFRLFNEPISEVEGVEYLFDGRGKKIKVAASFRGLNQDQAKEGAVDYLTEKGVLLGADGLVEVTTEISERETHNPNGMYSPTQIAQQFSHLQLAERHLIITVKVSGYAIRKV